MPVLREARASRPDPIVCCGGGGRAGPGGSPACSGERQKGKLRTPGRGRARNGPARQATPTPIARARPRDVRGRRRQRERERRRRRPRLQIAVVWLLLATEPLPSAQPRSPGKEGRQAGRQEGGGEGEPRRRSLGRSHRPPLSFGPGRLRSFLGGSDPGPGGTPGLRGRLGSVKFWKKKFAKIQEAKHGSSRTGFLGSVGTAGAVDSATQRRRVGLTLSPRLRGSRAPTRLPFPFHPRCRQPFVLRTVGASRVQGFFPGHPRVEDVNLTPQGLRGFGELSGSPRLRTREALQATPPVRRAASDWPSRRCPFPPWVIPEAPSRTRPLRAASDWLRRVF